MSNLVVTDDIIAAMTLKNLMNNCVMSANVYNGHAKEFVKKGASIRIKKPNMFVAQNGKIRVNQDVTEGTITLTIDQQEHVSWLFSQIDMTLSIKDFNEQYCKPAGIALANALDEFLTGLYYKFYHSGGTPGTIPGTFAALGDQATILDDFAVPDDGQRKIIMSSAMRWQMADALKGVFLQKMVGDVIKKGFLGPIANFDLYGDQNIIKHTTGSRTSTALDCLVNGAAQHSNAAPQANTQSLIIDDSSVAGATIKQGDVFTIANVLSVNPISKRSTGRLQHFSVQADVTLAAGAGTITIAPAIVTTGPYQNVDSIPADNAGLTFTGAASTIFAQNLAFHKNAIALAVVPIELPKGAAAKSRASHDGVSVAMVQDFDIDNYDEITRMDILFGANAQYAVTGSRLWGGTLG